MVGMLQGDQCERHVSAFNRDQCERHVSAFNRPLNNWTVGYVTDVFYV